MASASPDRRREPRNKPKRSEPPNQDCGIGRVEHLTPGKFYITGRLETTPNAGYQADSAATVQPPGGPERIRGQPPLGGSEESWLRLQPVVQCGDDAMTLTVRRRRAVQLQLDRVNESSVPLSQLPPQCGYSVQTTWRDLSLSARYDACYVTREDDGYALPLLWRGTPVQVSCPDPRVQPRAAGPPSLCCSPHGMTVRMQGAPEQLSVNVRGEWTPLEQLAEQCGYRLERQDAVIIMAAPFITCGVAVKPNRRSYDSYPGVEAYTHFGSRGSPPATVAAEDSGRARHDLSDGPSVSERHGAARSPSSNTGLPTPAESPPPLQPPNHAFNPYYHYYHHPKIPLRGPPQDAHAGPREVSLANPNDPEALALQRFLQPVPPAASHPPPPPEASALYTPPPPDPNHYYYPRIAQGPAVREAPLNPEANVPDHQISESGAFVDPPPYPLEAASPPPSTSPSASPSPAGLGRASYFDCSVSLGCCSYPVTDCTMGQHLIFAVPDSVVQPTVAPPAPPSEGSNVSCALQKLTSDLYAVPLDGCGVNTQQALGQTVVHRLEVVALQRDHSAELETSPVRLLLECISIPDETFSSFHPEAHLPLSRLRGRSVHVQLSLPDPPEAGLVLLVHSCMAFTQAPHPGWMLVYDGCASGAQLLPSPRSNPHLIRRISFSGFLSLDSERPSYAAGGGASRLGDPEIYFLCLTEVCSAAGGGCTLGCIDGRRMTVQTRAMTCGAETGGSEGWGWDKRAVQ
ncbi:Zona pellucida sperm-binding protein 1 [Liparis tanakae]|uniref:Zona pellucida sperm-binding protein 1 n=1 Tax=Liparis tanakae TaxID=230148 RepID=A0A4Z2G2L5_9TELE|nr:Zona pellucida sperm-binding protein 1 [Liparis tanakae]